MGLHNTTTRDPRLRYQQLSLRNMRVDFVDRVRLVAALRSTTMEAAWLDIVERGLTAVEKAEGIVPRRAAARR